MDWLIRKIGNKITEHTSNEMEIEYDSKYWKGYVDIRLYGTSYALVYKIGKELKKCDFIQENVENIYIEIPHEDVVKYGFSGHYFISIVLKLNNDMVETRNPSVMMRNNEITNVLWEN